MVQSECDESARAHVEERWTWIVRSGLWFLRGGVHGNRFMNED